jgi:MFS transporter, DHA1 family, multidrug resistance protein
MISSTPEADTPRPGVVFIALLIAVSALSPLGINIYLPSMPSMARTLGANYTTIQLTLSLYLAAMAIGQLVMGPLSDRFGRRPVLLTGLVVFVIGSFICLLAPSSGILILGRVVQGIGGCAGITLGRAIVRDLYKRNEVVRVIGYITMGMAIPPMIAPTIGGVLDAFFGWRASFAFLTAFGAITFFGVFLWLYETNHNRYSKNAAPNYLRDYGSLLRSRQFWGYTLVISLAMAMFYAFAAGAPYVAIELMGRSPTEYGLYFALIPGGYIFGSFAAGRLAGRFMANWLILIGLTISLTAVVVMALIFAKGSMHPVTLFVPTFFICIGHGVLLPTGLAGVVNVKPELAGAAAGLAGSIQIGFGALVAPIVGATLFDSVWPLIIIMTVSVLLALAAFVLIKENQELTSY